MDPSQPPQLNQDQQPNPIQPGQAEQPGNSGQVVAVSVGNGGGPGQPSDGGVTALGVIATVLGSIALLGSFIPCLGALAIYVAIPAAICGIIGIVMANSKKVSMTLCIVGTVLGVIGGIIATMQIIALKKTAEGIEELGDEIGESLEKAGKEWEAQREKELKAEKERAEKLRNATPPSE